MPFSDKDLSELKRRLDPLGVEAIVGHPIYKWRALLARLEAAEYLIKLKDYGDANRKCWPESHQFAWKAWCAASGK